MNKTILYTTGGFIIGAAVGFLLGYKFKEQEDSAERDELVNQIKETQVKSEAEREKLVNQIKKANKTVNEMQVRSIIENNEKPIITDVSPKIVSDGPAKLATPEVPGVNYSAYAKKIEELNYQRGSLAPTDGDDTELTEEEDEDIPEDEETFDERVDRENDAINEECKKYKEKKGNQIDVLGNNPIDNDYPNVSYQTESLLYFIPDDFVTDMVGNRIDEMDILGNKLRRFGWFQNEQESVWVRNNKYETDYQITKIDDDYASYFNLSDDEEE